MSPAPAIGAAARAVSSERAAAAFANRPRAPKVKVRKQPVSQTPVISAMTVVVAAGVLKSIMVDGEDMPGRKFWLNTAIIGFVLALLTELTPKLGKSMSYLVLFSVAAAQTAPIIDAFTEKQKEIDIRDRRKKPLQPLTPMPNLIRPSSQSSPESPVTS